jgi:sterol desaturase/sphingolipid hydroxylase (fatty acid hydroxylase superfamily)
MSLYVLLSAGLLTSGLTMAAMTGLFRSEYGQAHQIRVSERDNSTGDFLQNAVVSSVLSLVLVFGLTFATLPWLFHAGPVSALRVALEAAGLLLLYDFFYYFLHRYAFHEWKVLRKVHAVHHLVRNPSAIDSLYLHPVETTLGLALLWVCAGVVTVLVGPVSYPGFALAFVVYSVLNVVVHCGLAFRLFPLSLISHMATRHNRHHVSMKGKNYASITSLWDRLLGTEV